MMSKLILFIKIYLIVFFGEKERVWVADLESSFGKACDCCWVDDLLNFGWTFDAEAEDKSDCCKGDMSDWAKFGGKITFERISGGE